MACDCVRGQRPKYFNEVFVAPPSVTDQWWSSSPTAVGKLPSELNTHKFISRLEFKSDPNK